jgi:hypothetical protein
MSTPKTTLAVRPIGAGVLTLSILLFLVAANAPYAWLIANFGYDDILREPTTVVLRRFRDGGSALVLAWLAFAVGAMLFIPVALGMRRLLVAHGIDDHGAAILGVGSAIAQATGLLRWVLVVPSLAEAYTAPESTAAARAASVIAFDAVHRLAGMVIGEMLGQLLLAGWTALTVLHLTRARLVPRWLLLFGAVVPPLWLIGQTELLHDVVPAVSSVEVTPAAFMLWEAWLAIVATAILTRALRAGRSGPSEDGSNS